MIFKALVKIGARHSQRRNTNKPMKRCLVLLVIQKQNGFWQRQKKKLLVVFRFIENVGKQVLLYVYF